MNNESQGSSTSTGGPNERGGSHFEREATFSPSGPERAKIATRSGEVMVRTGENNELVVTLSANSPKFANLLELAEIHFDAKTNQLEIRSQQQNGGGSRGRRVSRASWFDFGGTDLDAPGEVSGGEEVIYVKVNTVSSDLRADKAS
jgi:hypothetical protein